MIDAKKRTIGKLLGAFLAALALLTTGVAADEIVTTEGEQITTRGPWEIRGRSIVYTNENGVLSSIRLSLVDVDASRAATERAAANPKQWGVTEIRRPEPPPKPPPHPNTQKEAVVITQEEVGGAQVTLMDERVTVMIGALPPTQRRRLEGMLGEFGLDVLRADQQFDLLRPTGVRKLMPTLLEWSERWRKDAEYEEHPETANVLASMAESIEALYELVDRSPMAAISVLRETVETARRMIANSRTRRR